MTEQASPPSNITDNDRLLAALSYPIPVVAIVILLVQEMKDRPFQRYHAVQALAANVALWLVMTVLGCILGVISAVIGGLCGIGPGILWLVTLYWAYQAYQGQYSEIPWLTQFLKGQKWL